MVSLPKIRKYQKNIDPIIPKAPFSHVVKEIMEQYSDRVNQIQSATLEALQDAIEDVIALLFQDSILWTIRAK